MSLPYAVNLSASNLSLFGDRNAASWTSLRHTYDTGVTMDWAKYELSEAKKPIVSDKKWPLVRYVHRDVWWLSK